MQPLGGKGTESPSAGREGSRQLAPSTAGGIPRAWGQAKGGRQAVSSGERRPLVLGGRAGTCLDPSKPMGKM